MNGHRLSHAERDELLRLREERRARFAREKLEREGLSFAQRSADLVARVVGSWTFIIVQSLLFVLWIVLNALAWVNHWDPYPFILLNLALSFQAAFTAPIIMMSQNRQAEVDREEAHHDFEINRKAELEIEALHEKIDLLREQEIARLIAVLESSERKREDERK